MSDDTETPRRDIVSRDEGRTLLRPSPLIRRGLDQLRTTPDRILYFPPDRAVGLVWARDRPDGYRDWEHPAWERIGEARGEVRVRAGKEICFEAKTPSEGFPLSSFSAEEQEQLRCRDDVYFAYYDTIKGEVSDDPDAGQLYVWFFGEKVHVGSLGIGNVDYLGFDRDFEIDQNDVQALHRLTGLTGLQFWRMDLRQGVLDAVTGMFQLVGHAANRWH